MPIDTARYRQEFPSLQFLAPEDGILELVMSLALEFLGFRLADIREGLAAAREKRRPTFE
jgi:hypothetical protein